MTAFRSIVATNTGQSIKTTGANVYGINIINRHNAAIFVKFYNSDVATFQDTPVKVFQVAASSFYPASPTPAGGVPANFLFGTSEGLSVRVVTGADDDNNTSASTLPIIEVEYN